VLTACADVLIELDSTAIADDGTVAFRDGIPHDWTVMRGDPAHKCALTAAGERISFKYLLLQKFVGDEAKFTVLRKGQQIEIKVGLRNPHPLVPFYLETRLPTYDVLPAFQYIVIHLFFLTLLQILHFRRLGLPSPHAALFAVALLFFPKRKKYLIANMYRLD
jgi:hypothetical protein